MFQSFFKYLIIAIASLSSVCLGSIDSSKEVRLKVHLSRIESKAKSERYWGGGTSLAIGVGLGVAALSTDKPKDATAYGIAGGVLGAAGLFSLLFPTEFETGPQEFEKLPNSPDSALKAKVAKGESILKGLSAKAKSRRVYGGIISIAAGGAYLGWYASDSSVDGRLYAGAILAGSGIASLLVQHWAESEWEEYHRWSKELAFSWDVMPLNSGALAVATWHL